MGIKLRKVSNVPGQFTFWCEGCEMYHLVWTKPAHGNSAVWQFNGSVEKPTFSPSLLVRHGQDQVCHSFIKDGKIEYLSDCTHKLAGKTVELTDQKS